MKSTIRFVIKRLRPSIRVLMGLILIFGVVLARFVNEASEQREAVAAIKQTGGAVIYDWQLPGPRLNPQTGEVSWPSPRGPLWLRQILGPHYFDSVVLVNDPCCRAEGMNEAAVANLINQLHRLPRLRIVSLPWSKMTHASFERLGELNDVEDLDLGGVPVTDTDLLHLARIKSLKSLRLYRCDRISDAGIKHLKSLTNLETLNLTRTNVTDACVEDLVAMKSLKWLAVGASSLSLRAIADLEARMPGVRFDTNPQ